MGAFTGLFKYVMVILVSLSISQLMKKDSTSSGIIGTLDNTFSTLRNIADSKLGFKAPLVELQKTLGILLSSQIDFYIWNFLTYFPFVSVIGLRKHLSFYFFFLGAVLIFQILSTNGNMEVFLANNSDRILIMGLAGYASTV